MSDRTHVPDKLQGYLIQVRHMLYELISLDLEHIVSIEAYDDIAIETEDSIIAEQIKSVTSDNNPMANRATVFWKTLYNWCTYISSNALPTKAIVLRFITISDRDITIGSIPKSFDDAITDDQAKEALEKARKELYVAEDGSPKEIAKSYKEYVDYLFSDVNEGTVIAVIKALSIEVHVADYDDKLKKRFNSQLIPVEYADELFEYMLGWVTDEVQSQTKANKPAYISVEKYRDALQAQIRGKDLNRIFAAVSTMPSNERMAAEIDRQDTYIKQLSFIEVESTDIFTAASDFLRASTEKTAWAKKGIVIPQSFDDYYDGLMRTWRTQQRLIALTSTSTDVENGQKLYYICGDAGRSLKLQGNELPPFFGSGCLHSLANEPSDKPQIGWHPQYIQLLEQEAHDDEQSDT